LHKKLRVGFCDLRKDSHGGCTSTFLCHQDLTSLAARDMICMTFVGFFFGSAIPALLVFDEGQLWSSHSGLRRHLASSIPSFYLELGTPSSSLPLSNHSTKSSFLIFHIWLAVLTWLMRNEVNELEWARLTIGVRHVICTAIMIMVNEWDTDGIHKEIAVSISFFLFPFSLWIEMGWFLLWDRLWWKISVSVIPPFTTAVPKRSTSSSLCEALDLIILVGSSPTLQAGSYWNTWRCSIVRPFLFIYFFCILKCSLVWTQGQRTTRIRCWFLFFYFFLFFIYINSELWEAVLSRFFGRLSFPFFLMQ